MWYQLSTTEKLQVINDLLSSSVNREYEQGRVLSLLLANELNNCYTDVEISLLDDFHEKHGVCAMELAHLESA